MQKVKDFSAKILYKRSVAWLTHNAEPSIQQMNCICVRITNCTHEPKIRNQDSGNENSNLLFEMEESTTQHEAINAQDRHGAALVNNKVGVAGVKSKLGKESQGWLIAKTVEDQKLKHSNS